MKSKKTITFHILTSVILFASLLGSAMTVTPVQAAGITVNSNADTVTNDSFCTLREAIINANNDAATHPDCPAGFGADTITFADNYTITLVGEQLPTVTSPITVNGNGITSTRIQANATPYTATYRVLEVSVSGNLTLDGLSIRHGRCVGACVTAGYHGGGILNYGTLTVTNSWLSNNLADNYGGGIYNSGTLIVTNSMFENGNYAYYGGGIYNSEGTVTVTGSTFWLNSATYGGGIYNGNGTLTVTNSTLSENFASSQGGGILNDIYGVLTVTNSTLSENRAPNAGGIAGIYNLNILNFSNTIIANSSGGDCENGSGGTISTNLNNLVEDGSCGAALNGDPNLGPLDDSGSTWKYPLLAGSPAIDAGDDATCANPPVDNLDQRGVTRPQGSHCDIGAFEYQENASPSVVSIARASTSPTSASSVDFTVTFSEPVTGVDADGSDFELFTSGVSGASITSVSGSGSVYTVSVNTGSGDGSIRLDLPDTASISDLSGNPLSNLPFTSGETYSLIRSTSSSITRMADFNGDGKDDIAVFRPSNSTWYIYGVGSFVYGSPGDIPVPADYNGDGKDDIAVFRPSNSTWYIYGVGPFVYGTAGDVPVVADYNGDGKDDIAVFRPSNSTWYIYGVGPFVYGTAGDVPVVADYNGDGKDDIAVFRPSNSTWYIYGVGPFVYGTAGDVPVVADYNGDGKDDIAVFRPSNSTWYIYGVGPFVYGTAGDVPVVADYNGDGKDDIAVFRPSNSTWYIYGVGPFVYGTVGDVPV